MRAGSIFYICSVPAGEFEVLAEACLDHAGEAGNPDDEAVWLAAALEWLRLAAAARDALATIVSAAPAPD
jgi:hypothetical protein